VLTVESRPFVDCFDVYSQAAFVFRDEVASIVLTVISFPFVDCLNMRGQVAFVFGGEVASIVPAAKQFELPLMKRAIMNHHTDFGFK
jgi:hypothetical protein